MQSGICCAEAAAHIRSKRNTANPVSTAGMMALFGAGSARQWIDPPEEGMHPAHWIRAALCVVLIGVVAAAAAEIPSEMRGEIEHLIAYLRQSECRFERNGRWYDADDAAAHIERKLNWLEKRDLIASTEQFIERAASESSRSGEPYHVQCGAAPAVTSREWFTAELERLRAAQR